MVVRHAGEVGFVGGEVERRRVVGNLLAGSFPAAAEGENTGERISDAWRF